MLEAEVSQLKLAIVPKIREILFFKEKKVFESLRSGNMQYPEPKYLVLSVLYLLLPCDIGDSPALASSSYCTHIGSP